MFEGIWFDRSSNIAEYRLDGYLMEICWENNNDRVSGYVFVDREFSHIAYKSK